MKRILLIGVVIFAAFWFVWIEVSKVNPVYAAKEPGVSIRTVFRDHLSPELIIPPNLPATIQDNLLLEAWIHLYNAGRPVPLWDGSTISGNALAQFVLDHAIPLVWDTGNVCHGDSCSVNYCTGDVCTHEGGQPGVAPIYISLYFKNLKEDQMRRLVESLAHEIYHRMEPFGQVKDSEYEEFTAIYLSAQISGSTWQNFKGYDPRNPVCLKRWFNNHRLFSYLDLPVYPQSVAASLASPVPTDCTLDGDLICTTTLEGQANCQTVSVKASSTDQGKNH